MEKFNAGVNSNCGSWKEFAKGQTKCFAIIFTLQQQKKIRLLIVSLFLITPVLLAKFCNIQCACKIIIIYNAMF